MISKEEAKSVWEEIDATYDFINVIVDEIEADDGVDPKVKCELAEDFVNKITDTTELLGDEYMNWYENDQKSTPKQVKKSEASARTMFNASLEFIKKVALIPSTTTQTLTEEESMSKDTIKKSEVLPLVGKNKGDLQHGEMWKMFEEQIARLPELEKLIRSVRNAGIHIWRIAYYFISKANCIIVEAQNILIGRKMADLLSGVDKGVNVEGKGFVPREPDGNVKYKLSF